MKMKNDSLEKKRPLLLTAGFLFAVSMALVSFEWRTPYYGETIGDPDPVDDPYTYETPPITIREVEEVKERPEPPKLETDQFDIVDEVDPEEDEVEIEEVEPIEVPKEPIVFVSPVEEDVFEDDTFRIVEIMPLYPGGEGELLKYLANNTEYPRIAKENGISGVVHVHYMVNKKGKVTNVRIARSVDSHLDKEAIRVVKSINGYKAGKQRGKPVNVEFTVPIHFQLQ